MGVVFCAVLFIHARNCFGVSLYFSAASCLGDFVMPEKLLSFRMYVHRLESCLLSF